MRRRTTCYPLSRLSIRSGGALPSGRGHRQSPTLRFWRRHFRQHVVDIRAVDNHMLDEDTRLDFVAFEISREHIDAEPAPQDRIKLDRHGDVSFLHPLEYRPHAIHTSDDRLTVL